MQRLHFSPQISQLLTRSKHRSELLLGLHQLQPLM
jgi:hypothetical protein